MNLALRCRYRLCSSASCNCIRERDNKIVRAVEGEPARFVTVLCRILGLTRSRVKYLAVMENLSKIGGHEILLRAERKFFLNY